MDFNYSRLRGRIREVYGTENAFAKALGIGRVSMSKRLNNELDFTGREINSSCQLLGIAPTEISNYFFTAEVQKRERAAGEVIRNA